MAETTTKRLYAVVTGGNKGIGFEICRQLASNGVLVVLTARDESRGHQAVEKLKTGDPSLSDYIVFHQLDVTDSQSISSLADFITTQFGKLDILVNNAGIFGALINVDAMTDPGDDKGLDSITDTYELAEECFKTNYHGSKQMMETFMSLLQQSDSPRVVNVSSFYGQLKMVKNEWDRSVLSDIENLTEEKVEEVLKEYLKDIKEGLLQTKGWPRAGSAYTLAKAALNAYSRIIAKKYPTLCINCVCPGYVKTDMNNSMGFGTPQQGAEGPVNWHCCPVVALLVVSLIRQKKGLSDGSRIFA